jgi:hypothetical protein
VIFFCLTAPPGLPILGDTTDCVTITVTPAAALTPAFPPFALSSSPNNNTTNCYASLSFSSASGQGSVSSTVTASPAACGGIFTGYALAGPNGNSSNTIQVAVPPEVLVQMIWGETNGQGAIGDNVSEQAVGVAARNRFSQPQFFSSVTTYQAAVTPCPCPPGQFNGVNRAVANNIYNGPSPELSNAVAVFVGTTNVTVANAGCFFTPTASDWANIIGPQLVYQTATLVPASNDPQCYTKTPYGQQYLVKQSIANNANGQGAPAFIFVQQKPSANAPTVTLIP